MEHRVSADKFAAEFLIGRMMSEKCYHFNELAYEVTGRRALSINSYCALTREAEQIRSEKFTIR